MHKHETQTLEQNDTQIAYELLLQLEPTPIEEFKSLNAAEQKAAFLNDEITNPSHIYDRLDAVDFVGRQKEIAQVGKNLLQSSSITEKNRASYKDFVDSYTDKLQFEQAAFRFNHAATEDEKQKAADEYMARNIEQFGQPDEVTYRSILHDKVAAIDAKNIGEKAATLRTELHGRLPDTSLVAGEERFKPSAETLAWMSGVAETLYGGMVSHVPERKMFDADGVKDTFTTIIEQEFGEAAFGWRVEIGKGAAISVQAAKKLITVHESARIAHADMLSLVAHELGVHMLRSIMGEETDLAPLRTGLNNYYDSEEGLGMVMEQALRGIFAERGLDHYITAGLAGIDGNDFRNTFEVKWRLRALEVVEEEQDITDEIIVKARDRAYRECMRMFRGTDELPWFKDLAYYNGTVEMWKHLEEIQGDDLQFMFVLLGKANPANPSHRRQVLETSSR